MSVEEARRRLLGAWRLTDFQDRDDPQSEWVDMVAATSPELSQEGHERVFRVSGDELVLDDVTWRRRLHRLPERRRTLGHDPWRT
jgi:hypothetical protein